MHKLLSIRRCFSSFSVIVFINCVLILEKKYISIENLLQNKQVDLPLKFNYLTVLLFNLAQLLFHITEYMAARKINNM